LDGTVNYLFGIPVWAVSISARDGQGLLVGVTHDPNRNETFAASRGGGATMNGRPIQVSDVAELSTAMIGTGFSYDSEARGKQARLLLGLLPEVRDIRRAGSAAIDLAWLACGRLDGFYEAPMKPWDRAAGELLVTEAGGVVSSLPAPIGDDTGVIAAGPRLHPALRELVHG
jgi:myo-inositol-1(or 4)-monophosphatase